MTTRRLLILLCATTMPHMLSAQTPGLVDERPPAESKSRNLSSSIFSCSYGIRVFDDEGRTRTRLAALDAALASTFGQRARQHRIVVRSYQLYFNSAASQVDRAVAIATTSQGGTVDRHSATAPKCGHDKTPEGWFDPSETSNANPPFIVQIEASIDGKPLSVRSVYSPSTLLQVPSTAFNGRAKKNFATGDAAVEVDKAIDKANADFVRKATALLQ